MVKSRNNWERMERKVTQVRIPKRKKLQSKRTAVMLNIIHTEV